MAAVLAMFSWGGARRREGGRGGESGVAAFPVVDFAGIGKRADLAVVLGGDGTMLSAARALASSGVPLVGINQGRLGVLTDIALESMTPNMASILAGQDALGPRSRAGAGGGG